MKTTECPHGYSMTYIKENFGLDDTFSKCAGCEFFKYTGDECFCDLLTLSKIKDDIYAILEENEFNPNINKPKRVVIEISVPEEKNIEGE